MAVPRGCARLAGCTLAEIYDVVWSGRLTISMEDAPCEQAQSATLAAASSLRLRSGKFRLRWLTSFAPWILVAVPAMTTIAATVWSALQHGLSQDTAAWAQAAGSVIAICAAIWISDRENGRRRREQMDLQDASVWAVLYALQLAEKETALIYFQVKESPDPIDGGSWKDWRTMLNNCCAMLRYAGDRVDHFHPGFAQEAHNAIILGDELVALFDEHRKKFDVNADRADLMTDLGSYAYNFSILKQRISHRMLHVRRRIASGKRIDHDWDSYDGPEYFNEGTS